MPIRTLLVEENKEVKLRTKR